LDERIPGDAPLVIPSDKVRLQHPAENPERNNHQQSADYQMTTQQVHSHNPFNPRIDGSAHLRPPS
jgi:hypothetical protein